MSLESAQQFVSRMNGDKEFRTAVEHCADTMALIVFLRSQGYEFDQRELVGAMAACMGELDATPQVCRQ